MSMRILLVVAVLFYSILPVHLDAEARAEAGRGGLLAGLELSQEQRQELRSMKGARDEIRNLGQQAQQQRKRLMQMLRGHDASDAEIRVQLQNATTSSASVMEHRVEALLKFRNILTEAQYKKFADRLAEKMQGARERFRRPQQLQH